MLLLARLGLAQNSLGVSYVGGRRIASMEGIAALADAVSQSPSLKKLAIAYNGIGAMGGKAFAEAFGASASLSALDISGNLIGLKGGKAIADALVANPSITSVDVRFNSLDERTKSALKEASSAATVKL